jgi:hypothetical protein
MEAQNNPEKVFISLDKDIYLNGEDLWFSTYVLNNKTHKISNKSKLIFLALLDRNKEIKVFKKFQIDQGRSSGKIKVPDDLKEDYYFLLAFTQYSLNEASHLSKQLKPIKVYNSLYKKYQLDYDTKVESDSLIVNIQLKRPDTKGTVRATLEVEKENGGTKKISKKIGLWQEASFVLKDFQKFNYSKISIRVKDDQIKETYTLLLPNTLHKKPSISIHSENGKLVSNSEQKVLLKLENDAFLNKVQRLSLYDNNHLVQHITVDETGTGFFNFTPKNGRRYYIEFNGQKFDLPLSFESPAKLQYDEQNQQVRIQKLATSNAVDSLFLEHWYRGKRINKILLNTIERETIYDISQFETGIHHVRLMQHSKMMGERFLFVDQRKKNPVVNDQLVRNKTKKMIQFESKITQSLDQNAEAFVFKSLFDSDRLDRNINSDMAFLHLVDQEFQRSIPKGNNISLNQKLMVMSSKEYAWANSKKFIPYFNEHLLGSVYQKHIHEGLVPQKNHVFGGIIDQKLIQITTDSLGKFRIPVQFFLNFKGNDLNLFRNALDTYVIKLEDNKTKLKNLLSKTDYHPFINIHLPLKKQTKNLNAIQFSTYYNNMLNEVKVGGNGKGSSVKRFGEAILGDYVCYEYDILNCVNHKRGYPPVPGEQYKSYENGILTTVVYQFAPKDKSKDYKQTITGVSTSDYFNNKGVLDEFAQFNTTYFWSPFQLIYSGKKFVATFRDPIDKKKFVFRYYLQNGNRFFFEEKDILK